MKQRGRNNVVMWQSVPRMSWHRRVTGKIEHSYQASWT